MKLIYILFIFVFFAQPVQAYTEMAASVAKKDPSKDKPIETKKTMEVVDKVLKENLKPETAAVVSMVAEHALKKEDKEAGREPTDKVATSGDKSLSAKADEEIKKNVEPEIVACGAKAACDGKPKCPCDDGAKEGDAAATPVKEDEKPKDEKEKAPPSDGKGGNSGKEDSASHGKENDASDKKGTSSGEKEHSSKESSAHAQTPAAKPEAHAEP